jgi:aspartyl-tRNA(Asn)/glutamyl-tRNA(Gln) amidotransferase subunit A
LLTILVGFINNRNSPGAAASRQTAPMPDLAYLSAHDTLGLFRSGELSPTEHLEALIEQIESHDAALNAVVDRRYDEARAEARAAEQRYLGRGDPPRALEGVCVAAKEEQPMAGRSWQQGSLAFADEIAKYDHPIIERIQGAGGVIHIRTATPEFSCAGFCHSALWGVTRNPWNTEFTPGGSSGGSGAALAAGYAPLATGSDIGGSIRIPASFSGVVGFKPPFGRVPGLAPYHLDQYCHDGPMARTVADCGLLENVIAGPHWRDIVSLRNPPQIPATFDGLHGVRIALCVNLGDWPVDADVVTNTHLVADALRSAGANVEEVTLPWTMERIWQAARAHFAAIMGPGIGEIEVEHAELLNDYTRAFVATMQSKLTFYEGLVEETALWDPLGRRLRRRAPHRGDDDPAVQLVQPLPGAVGAEWVGSQRCSHRRASRRANLRRRQRLPSRRSDRGRRLRLRLAHLAPTARPLSSAHLHRRCAARVEFVLADPHVASFVRRVELDRGIAVRRRRIRVRRSLSIGRRAGHGCRRRTVLQCRAELSVHCRGMGDNPRSPARWAGRGDAGRHRVAVPARRADGRWCRRLRRRTA